MNTTETIHMPLPRKLTKPGRRKLQSKLAAADDFLRESQTAGYFPLAIDLEQIRLMTPVAPPETDRVGDAIAAVLIGYAHGILGVPRGSARYPSPATVPGIHWALALITVAVDRADSRLLSEFADQVEEAEQAPSGDAAP